MTGEEANLYEIFQAEPNTVLTSLLHYLDPPSISQYMAEKCTTDTIAIPRSRAHHHYGFVIGDSGTNLSDTLESLNACVGTFGGYVAYATCDPFTSEASLLTMHNLTCLGMGRRQNQREHAGQERSELCMLSLQP